MIEEIEIQEIEDVTLIPVNKETIQKLVHIVIIQDIVRPTAGKNILRNCQTLRKILNSKKRAMSSVLQVTAKTIVFLLILRHN